MVRGSISGRKEISLLSKIMLTTPWTHSPSPGEKRPELQLISHLQVVSELRMNGAIPLLSLYVFMTWPVTTFFFIFYLQAIMWVLEIAMSSISEPPALSTLYVLDFKLSPCYEYCNLSFG